MDGYDMPPFYPNGMAGNAPPVQYPWPPIHSPYPYDVHNPSQIFTSIWNPWNLPPGFQLPFQIEIFNRQQPNNQLEHNATVDHGGLESQRDRLTRQRLAAEQKLEDERVAKVEQYRAERPVADLVEQLLLDNINASIEGRPVPNPEWAEAHTFLQSIFFGEVNDLLKRVPTGLAPDDRSNVNIDALYIGKLIRHGMELKSEDIWKAALITARVRLWDNEGLFVHYSDY